MMTFFIAVSQEGEEEQAQEAAGATAAGVESLARHIHQFSKLYFSLIVVIKCPRSRCCYFDFLQNIVLKGWGSEPGIF
jgi:hypothetical protein